MCQNPKYYHYSNIPWSWWQSSSHAITFTVTNTGLQWKDKREHCFQSYKQYNCLCPLQTYTSSFVYSLNVLFYSIIEVMTICSDVKKRDTLTERAHIPSKHAQNEAPPSQFIVSLFSTGILFQRLFFLKIALSRSTFTHCT